MIMFWHYISYTYVIVHPGRGVLSDGGGLDRGPCHDVYSSVHPGEGSSSVALLKVSSLLSPERFF